MNEVKLMNVTFDALEKATSEPYRILDLVQGTAEWKKARFNYITASNVAAVLGVCPYKTPLQLAEMLLSREETAVGPDKQRIFDYGHQVEKAGKEWIESHIGISFLPVVAESLIVRPLMASLDGFNKEKNLIFEAKYVGKERLAEMKEGKVPVHFQVQVQAQLLTMGATRAILFAMDSEGNAATIEICPDKTVQADITKTIPAFWKSLETGILPEPTDRDITKVTDDRFRELADLNLEMKTLKSRYDELESQLLAEYPQGRIDGGPVLITRYYQKGNVDYAKACKGMDLEPYRKNGSLRTRVTIKKG